MIGHRCGAPSDLDGIALQVLTRFALAQPGLGLASQGNAGGFSGARLWRAKSLAGEVCLRAWPSEAIGSSRLQWIHNLMRSAREAGLDFVPRLFQTSAGIPGSPQPAGYGKPHPGCPAEPTITIIRAQRT